VARVGERRSDLEASRPQRAAADRADLLSAADSHIHLARASTLTLTGSPAEVVDQINARFNPRCRFEDGRRRPPLRLPNADLCPLGPGLAVSVVA